MRKIIALGKCGLDILMEGNTPVASFPGGRILNAAASLGRLGMDVTMVGECARDSVGDIIVSFLEECGVNTRSIDRYTEGVTPVSLIFGSEGRHTSTVAYDRYPAEGFDVVWPRIDADDIVIFGSYFALDSRIRPRLLEILNYAAERKAIIIYVPGFSQSEVPRITKVMPAILENFELADLVVTRSRDLKNIYNTEDSAVAYNQHISFYCRTMLNLDFDGRKMILYNGAETDEIDVAPSTNSLGWNAGAIAGVAEAIINRQLLRTSLERLDRPSRCEILSNAKSRAAEAAASPRNIIILK